MNLKDPVVIRELFEKWYADKYAWEISRGRGRLSRSLTTYDGEYTSDLTRNDYEVFKAAFEIMESVK